MRKIITNTANRVAQIKEATNLRIYAIFPIWRQLNLLMTAVRILNKKVDACLVALELDPLTPAEKLQEAKLDTIRAKIRAQRTRSDEMETQVNNHITVNEQNDTEWPTMGPN